MQQVEFNTPIGKVAAGKFACSDTYNDIAKKLNVPLTSQPVICVRGDVPVLRKDWDQPIGMIEEPIQFLQIPRGKSIKNILGLVATIALSLVAGPIAGLFFTAGTLGYSIASMAIILAGSFLINTFLAPKPAKAAEETSTEASPTYNLQGQGNAARLLDPIPRLYGEHILFPDYASQPYQSYESNEQYLYQLFCLGAGSYSVQSINIDKTELWNNSTGFSQTFSDVQIEIVPPGSTVTLFPSNVITSSEVASQELRNETFTVSTTFSGVRATFASAQAVVEFLSPGDVIAVSTTVGSNSGSWTITNLDEVGKLWIEFNHTFTSGTASSSFTLDDWIGPFIANPTDQNTNLIKIDVSLPRGLYYANDSGGLTATSLSYTVQCRAVDVDGVPLSGASWITLISETFQDNTSTSKRFTRSFNVGLGRYQVRARRTSVKNHDSRYGNDLVWESLRAFIPDDNKFDDVTLLAMKIRASNQLTQQSSTKINVVQRGLIPVYSNGIWSVPVYTANPAWVAADILKNSVYGAGLADSRVDLAKLTELAAIYTARGDTFNGVFDTSKTLWEALNSVLTTVRTQPILVAGMITFVRDQQKALAKTVITPQSILKNTFEMTHILKNEETADDVVVEFMDSRTWKTSEVECKLPGSTSENPARIQLFGVTNISQAWREGMYYAASNSYRRVFASVSTEADGRMLLKGDSVIVSHDVPEWSQNGYIYDYLEEETTLILDRQVKFINGAQHYIVLRRRDGKEFGPINCVFNGYDNEVKLDSASLEATEIAQGIQLADVLSIDDTAKNTTFVFGAGDKFAKRFLVINSTVRDFTKVDVGLVIDDPRVYAADTGTPPPGVKYNGPGVSPNAPIVSNLTVVKEPYSLNNPVTLKATWTVAEGSTNYILQYSATGANWTTIYTGTDTSFTFEVTSGDVFVRVAAVGTILGPWTNTDPFPQQFGTVPATPGIISNVVVEARFYDPIIQIDFTAAPRATSYKVEIFTEVIAGSGSYTSLKLTKTAASTSFAWSTSEITTAGGPWTRAKANVTAINGSGSSTAISTFFIFET